MTHRMERDTLALATTDTKGATTLLVERMGAAGDIVQALELEAHELRWLCFVAGPAMLDAHDRRPAVRP